MLLASDKPKNLIAILETGFLISRKKWGIYLLLSFLGVLSVTFPIFLKTQFSIPSAFTWVVAIISFIFSQLFLGGLIFFMYTSNKNLACSFTDALRVGLEKLPVLIMTLFLYILMVFIGTVAFIIPGLLLSILCLFGFILIYTDNHDPILALTSSFRFCQDRFLSVSIILFTIGLFTALVNLLALSFGYLLLMSFSIKPTELLFINLSLLTLVNTFVVPLSFGIMISLLHDLKIRRGSLLEQKI
jgi:hypothetical protein